MMLASPLGCTADVQDGEVLAGPRGGQAREVADRVGGQVREAGQPPEPAIAAPARRSIPIRARSRWAAAICAPVSPIRVSGVPQGISQPR